MLSFIGIKTTNKCNIENWEALTCRFETLFVLNIYFYFVLWNVIKLFSNDEMSESTAYIYNVDKVSNHN